MSRLHPPVAYGTYATRFVIAFVFVLAGLASGTTHATGRPAVGASPMLVRVVDGNGRPQYPATAIACPFVGTTSDCTHPIAQQVGPLGFTILQLDRSVRYRVFAFVPNPSPAWSCPGYQAGNDMLYISAESHDGTPAELPRIATFTIAEPTPYDCVPVRIFDDDHAPLPQAFLGICQYDPVNPPTYPPGPVTPCDPATWWAGADADGVIRVAVDPERSYDIMSFLSCRDGWFLFGEGNYTSAGYTVWRLSGADLSAHGLEITIHGDIATCVGP